MAGTSHFADAMRHPRTQVALAQFPISPADGVVLPALLVPIVRLCPSAYRYHRTYLSSTKREHTQDLQPPLRGNAPSPYFYEYPTNSNCVSVSRGTFLCAQFARQSRGTAQARGGRHASRRITSWLNLPSSTFRSRISIFPPF